MTTYTGARDALIALIVSTIGTDFPAVPIEYENIDSIDINAVGDQFIAVSIDFIDAKHATIEIRPAHRNLGELAFTFMHKEGTGSRKAAQWFDYVVSKFSDQIISGVVLGVPTPGKKKAKDGWVGYEIFVPFQFDRRF